MPSDHSDNSHNAFEVTDIDQLLHRAIADGKNVIETSPYELAQALGVTLSPEVADKVTTEALQAFLRRQPPALIKSNQGSCIEPANPKPGDDDGGRRPAPDPDKPTERPRPHPPKQG